MKINRFFIIVSLLFTVVTYGQFKNIRVSSQDAYQPEEITIAINPNNPEQIAAGSNLNYFFSKESKTSAWTQKNMTSALGVWGDPCVVYDTQNNLYFAHLSNPISGYWIDRIVIQKSSDNGKRWSDGIGVGFNEPKHQDKEWLAVDHSNSQFKNNIYMAWTEFDDYGSTNGKDSSRILFSYSNNSGNSWSKPVKVSDKEGNCIDDDETVEGAVPAIGPNGEVYVAWAGPLGLMFDKSLDGGKTFGKDIFISDIPGGWAFDIPGIDRCNGMPITACDISNSENRGNIYVGWSDQRNGSDNTDIFFSRSLDGGNTWSNPLKVNDDSSKRHQFFTWMTVDSTNGHIYFVFYDRRNTTGFATEVYLARSIDGGISFQNFKISESSFIPNSNVFFGDYINIAAFNGIIRPIWMRMDNGTLSVWTAEISDDELDATSVSETAKIKNYKLYQNYPNPFNPGTTIQYEIPVQAFVNIIVYNILGEKIDVLINKNQSAGIHTVSFEPKTSATSQVYFLKIIVNDYSETRKMLFLK